MPAAFSRITTVAKSEEDLSYMQNLRPLCDSLVEVKKMTKEHPLVPLAASVRRGIRADFAVSLEEMPDSNAKVVDIALNAMRAAEEEHGETEGGYLHTNHYMNSLSLQDTDASSIRPMAEFELRKVLFKNYLHHMKTLGELNSMPEITEVKIVRLSDAFLRGTSSERIAEHLSLYGSPLTNAELQDGFYALFEPEVKLVGDFMQQTPRFSSKKHKKQLKKWLDTYLLDELELNVKTRCVFMWVGDEWKEIRSLKDTDTEPTGSLLWSRREYFEEGLCVSKGMCDGYMKKIRLTDMEKQDWRTTVLRGWAFFFGICTLDSIVCGF
jgi:hypothetical protein